jgi:hypothetical protein
MPNGIDNSKKTSGEMKTEGESGKRKSQGKIDDSTQASSSPIHFNRTYEVRKFLMRWLRTEKTTSAIAKGP